MNKNVLVTGAGGFIGLNLVNELSQTNNRIHVLIEKKDIKSRAIFSTYKNCVIIDDFNELIENTKKYPKFNIIYHLATVGVNPAFKDISEICDVNIKMGCQLVDFAYENNTGLIVNFGSCFEYGNHGDKLLSEDDECYPESLYAISKNASVKLTTEYAKIKGIKLITVRPFGVFGNGENINRLVPSVIKSGLEHKPLDMTVGEQVRDFVNVKDVVKSIVCLTSSNNYIPYEIYNICSSNPVRVRDFIEEIIEVCGFDHSLYNFGALPYRKNEAMKFAGDNSKLMKTIDYTFPCNHTEGIKELLTNIKKEMDL